MIEIIILYLIGLGFISCIDKEKEELNSIKIFIIYLFSPLIICYILGEIMYDKYFE